MRAFYLSLAALALTLDVSDAVNSSGLLRERNEEEQRELRNGKGKSGTKGSKGKGKSSSALSPVCPGEETAKSKGGKGGKGGKSRFLEEVRQLSNGKGKGKGKSSGGDECDCDYPTDLCEDETPQMVMCNAFVNTDTVLSTSLGCEIDGATVTHGIIVDGATLECTGDGDNMIYNTGDVSQDEPCVVLRNGATLKNCHIYNCPIGVIMEGTGNNRIVGSTFFGNGENIETGSVPLSTHPRPAGQEDTGCYSVECSKIVGGMPNGVASVYLRHDGQFIMSNTDVLGAQNTPIYIHPEAGNTLNVAFDDVNVFGSSMGTTSRRIGIQIGPHVGPPPATPPVTWGTVGEVGFYGTTKLVAHRYAISQASVNSQATAPASIVVYGGIESYDTWVDSFQFADATVMFEDGSSGLACTFNVGLPAGATPPLENLPDIPPNGVSFDIQGAFMDLGASFVCAPGSAGITNPPVCVAGTGMCPGAPSIAMTCAGGSSSGKSKGGKGGKNGGKMSQNGGKMGKSRR